MNDDTGSDTCDRLNKVVVAIPLDTLLVLLTTPREKEAPSENVKHTGGFGFGMFKRMEFLQHSIFYFLLLVAICVAFRNELKEKLGSSNDQNQFAASSAGFQKAKARGLGGSNSDLDLCTSLIRSAESVCDGVQPNDEHANSLIKMYWDVRERVPKDRASRAALRNLDERAGQLSEMIAERNQ